MKRAITPHVIYVLLFVIGVIFSSSSIKAQTLEEVNFDSLGTWSMNTYATDIDDSGFVCGTYDSAGVTAAFVINNEGVIHRFIAAPGSSYEAMSINNKHTVLLKRTTGATIAVYKAYYIAYAQSYGTPIAVGNVQQPNAVPLGINWNNDISGYYPGGSSRWLFVLHDSITPPPAPTWDANRFAVGPTYYNTYGFGINDNNTVCGYYINSPNEIPFVYDGINGVFTELNANAVVEHPYDINNSNQMVGEYKQANGTMMGFWAQVNAPNVTFHSLNTIFQANTIQSKASGINNKGEIAGSYLDPTTSRWVGFIYRPNTSNYRLPGYSFNQHTWALSNSTSPTNGVWTTNYYGGFNYTTTDTYYPTINSPILDPYILGQYPSLATVNITAACVDWASFAAEVDTTTLLNNPNPVAQQKYKNIWRHLAFSRYKTGPARYTMTFPGICYGFAFTSLLKYYHDTTLHDWFGLSYNANIHAMTQSSTLGIRAIARTFTKQNDASQRNFQVNTRKWIKPWNGLYRLKNTYLDVDSARRNPRAIYIRRSGGYHSILPYKIKTPQKFPFNYGGSIARDSLFIYDSNFPDDTTQCFAINATSIYVPNDSSTNASYPDLKETVFNEAGYRQIIVDQHSKLKSTSIQEDSLFKVDIGPTAYYDGSDASGLVSYGASGYTNTTTGFVPLQYKSENTTHPESHTLDTAGGSIKIKSYQYTDNAMEWSLSSDHRIMGISRSAITTESDNTTINNRLMTYGTHDAASKTLSGYLDEMSNDYSTGVNILVHNLGVVQGDSLLTENPSQYIYKITKLTPGSTTYDLWAYTGGVDSVSQFITNGITLTGNTSHTIVPFYNGPNGTQLVVYVDQGMDGTYEDTLFITYVPVELNEVRHNADYIKVYPNPAQKQLSVSINRAQQGMYTVSLLDVLGREVYKQQMAFKAGNDVQQIPVASLAQGAYFICIADDKGKNIYMEKILKQ